MVPFSSSEVQGEIFLSVSAANGAHHHALIQAPVAAKGLLTKSTPADFDWLPDAEWQRISQRWGLDEDSQDAIFLPASPGMAPGSGTGKGWDGTGAEPWDCLNVTAEKDKVVNPNFNTAAIGA